MTTEIKMYFNVGVVCKDSALFMFPNREKPIKAKKIIKKYPEFAREFDGSAAECCLSWYYKFNKAEGIFEFKDPECEDEVAEMLGVEVSEFVIKDEDSAESSASRLSEKEIEDVRDYIADIRLGLKFLDDTKRS